MTNSNPRIAFFTFPEQVNASLITQHSPAGFEIQTHSFKISDQEKAEILESCDFLLLFPSQISGRVLRRAPHLKLIQLISAGYDRLDLDVCRELGIPVANNGGANSIDVAEHTVALILASYRKLLEHSQRAKEGDWTVTLAATSCYTIHGKTVGIIGMGNIGRRVARLLSEFGATVLYFDQVRVEAAIEERMGIVWKDLEDLLRESDILTLHVPLNRETYHLIDSHEIGLMKRNALVVNTSRGEVINQHALTEALRAHSISGAALDVLEEEPPVSSTEIVEFENVLLTPHVAGITIDTWGRRARFAFRNIERVWEGEAPLALVAG